MSPADPAPDALSLIDRQVAMLTRLAEIGMELAEAALRQAKAPAAGDAPDPALSYARVARAVRLTLALQSRLAKDGATARSIEAARRRGRIHAQVERALAAERPETDADAEAAEQLSAAVWESLTEEDDAALLARPFEAVVARICATLGVANPLAQPVGPGGADPETPDGTARTPNARHRRRAAPPDNRACGPAGPPGLPHARFTPPPSPDPGPRLSGARGPPPG